MPTSALADIELVHPEPPAKGELKEVAPGLFWACLPLPFRLNHVNVWALHEHDGWSVIDCGCGTDEIREIWAHLLGHGLAGRPVRRLIATHGHVDHVGLAGWLTEKCDAEFHSTLTEWQSPQLFRADMANPPTERLARYFQQQGCPDGLATGLDGQRHGFRKLLGAMPPSFIRFRDGDTLQIGGRSWRALTNGGHAAEHASFYCAADKLLIAGDHILSKISPVIGVWESQPEADPLGEYFRSLPRFESLPEPILVLPSHGLPFRRLHRRVAQLRAHHELRLGEVLGALQQPQTAYRLSAALFPRHYDGSQARLALAETLAHVNYLLHKGQIVRQSHAGREPHTYALAVSEPVAAE